MLAYKCACACVCVHIMFIAHEADGPLNWFAALLAFTHDGDDDDCAAGGAGVS